MKKTITIKEAIEQGYTCALDETGEFYTTLKDLEEEFDYSLDLFLGSKETFKFAITPKAIAQIFEEHIDNQDEVNNEPEQLYDQLKKVDWEAVSALINPHFTTDYHSVTDIKIVR